MSGNGNGATNKKEFPLSNAGVRGFSLPGIKPVMTWAELRRIWPTWLERARKKQREAASAKT